MKFFFIFILSLLVTSCIGPLKELETQINDVYFDTDLDNTPEPLQENFQNKVTTDLLWTFNLKDLPETGEIVFADDFIYLITSSGHFQKIDNKTANILYSKNLNIFVSSGIFYDEIIENFFFIDSNNYLVKLDKDANLIWKTKLSNKSELVPIIFNNQIIFKYKNHNIQSFDIDSGLLLWDYKRQNPPLSISVQSPLMIADNILYSGFPGGKLVIIDPVSGAFLSELTVSRAKGVSDIEKTNDVSGNIVIINSLLFAASFNGDIVCFDRTSGKKVWSRNVSSYYGLTSDLVNLILKHENDSLYNFDRNNGKTIWKNSDLMHRKLSKPLIFKDFILITDYLGILHILDLNEGNLLGIIPLLSKDFEGFVDFSESGAIKNTVNSTKLYKHNDFAYIVLDNSKMVKMSINE